MNTASDTQNGEARIRELTAEFQQAVGVKDLDRIMSQYAPDVVAFDAVGELQFKGIEAYRAHWQRCFDFCQGDGFFETQDVSITASGDLAFSHSLSHCGGTNDKGEMQTAWMRGTRCWRLQGGDWKVVHEHFSMPFDMESGQACFGLEPRG
ncbi:nuclear transport factor 2 family protein [Pseudomonas sp. Q2-TVG4-2]|uniref:YybH family protein n=1 Tax=Pseudomonas sp. Q2-TVG4-2 TaxID=1685699 RepID=UPI0015E7AA3B|nr:nuclear transport factor 2 family protein [Pseudomonas sp. Q2-TVG4-2]